MSHKHCSANAIVDFSTKKLCSNLCVTAVETNFLKGDITKSIENLGGEVVEKVKPGVTCCISNKGTVQLY